MEVFIGRQPIFDEQEDLFGYELLYRSGQDKNEYMAEDSNRATIDVLVNSFFSIGFDELSNGKPCFVNFTEELLMSDIFENLSPNDIVIEILEDIPITPKLVKRIIEIKALGFRIALDDFVLHKEVTIYNELFPNIDYIKVDFLFSTAAERFEVEQLVSQSFPHIVLLAEKLETRVDYLAAKSAGYQLFQGYYFKQPQIIKGNEIPANLIQYYQVIALLQHDVPNIDEIVSQIESDVALSFKILKIINTSSKKTKKKIRSIKEAILLLGLEDLKQWIYILAYRESGRKKDNEMYEELMKTSLYRAKLCELISKSMGLKNYSESFLVGMFSLIDTLLEKPLNNILMQLPLSDTIVETVSGSKTELSSILQLTIALERFDWANVQILQQEVNLTSDKLQELVSNASLWVAQLTFNVGK